MVKKFLKIAGVKNEQEFYKKYPSEAAFFKAHPEAKDLKKHKKGGQLHKLDQLTSYQGDIDGLMPIAQDGWVQRAANAEFSCGAHPRSELRQSYEERTNPSKQMDKEELKALKKEYNASPYKDSVSVNDFYVAKLMAENHNRKMGREDKAYSKYFNPDTGAVLPTAGSSLREEGNLINTNRWFPGSTFLTPGDILQSVKKDYNISGPMKKSEMAKTMKKADEAGFFKPRSEQGGKFSRAEFGDYIGGDTIQSAKPLSFDSYLDQAMTAATGKSREQRLKEEANIKDQQKAAAASNSGGGGGMDIGSIMKMAGGLFGGGGSGGGDMSSLFSGGGGEGGLGSLMGGMAKRGKKVPKNQNAPITLNSSGAGFQNPVYGSDMYNTMWGSGSGSVSTGQTPIAGGAPAGIGDYTSQGMYTLDPNQTGAPINLGAMKTNSGGLGQTFQKMLGPAGKLIGAFNKLKQEKDARKLAERDEKISQLSLRAAESMPEQTKRRYLRPEDVTVQPNQLSPSYGVGTNVLAARDGMQIGGNLTEIQNMYNPGNLYSNLGYEPLNDSDQVKQYLRGGHLQKAQSGFSQFASAGGADMATQLGSMIGSDGQPNAGSEIGGTIGSTAGMIFGPAGQLVGGALGGIIGGALDRNAGKIERAKKHTAENVQKAGLTAGLRGINSQYSAYVKNGGWVSHEWQPQVITQFDGHPIESLLTKDPMMDTLRTGGNITQNNMYPTDQYALGGSLKTTWGGYAEPISHNPYMPGTGETIMFRGKSHEESDGNGHTGIGVKYGDKHNDSYTDYAEYGTEQADADVEVERGEPATEMLDPNTGDTNMVVFGNLKIPNSFVHEIGDTNARGKKFKTYVDFLSKVEEKQNKKIDKAMTELDELNDDSPFGLLKMNSLNATQIGGNMNLKDIAVKKTNAAALQNAINQTAEEHGVDADALAKGKYKIDKEAMKQKAKYGKDIFKAQTGANYPYHPITNPTGYKDRLEFSQDVKDIVSPASQEWYKRSPQYKADLSRPWDPKGNTGKKIYNEAFSKFKEQKQKGQKPFVPYRLNSNIAAIYEAALKDFNSQGSNEAPAERKLVKVSDVQTPAKTTTAKTTAVPQTTTTTSGSPNRKKVKAVVPGKTKAKVTPATQTPVATQDDYNLNIPLVDISEIDKEQPVASTTSNTTTTVPRLPEGKKKTNWFDAAKEAWNILLPYVKPSDQEGFDWSQAYPEMLALAMNQVEPVQAQLYQPDLGTPMDISLQDQLNANQADFNATQRAMGYNPAALAALSAMKYAANQKILGEQFRLNQAEKQRVYEGNRALLNDAQLKNLAILDQQMTRQETAKSKTKEQTLEAMKSIADKVAKNKLENRTLGIYENLYNYRFGKSGRAQNWNPLVQWDTTRADAITKSAGKGLPEGYEILYNAKGEPIKFNKTAKEDSDVPDLATQPIAGKNGLKAKKNTRNGNIVKAIKGL